MKGLELAEKYYQTVGRPMIERALPEVLPFLAAGLCGDGSDCLGYDDEISRDHDFGPGFCIWLEPEAYALYGQVLQELYDLLPAEFEGFSGRDPDVHSGKRVGVFRIPDYYESYLGSDHLPGSYAEWNRIPEERMAACISGRVFEDRPGVFSSFRNSLLNYYPEPVRLEKIAGCVHLIAQTGQYNYARCMRRGDFMAAYLSLGEFVRQVIHLIHLLDRKYEPYYKWAWKSFAGLPDSAGLTLPLSRLTALSSDTAAWNGLSGSGSGINLKDERVLLIESICRRLLELLRVQGLTGRNELFLDAHTEEILSHNV